MKTFGKIFGNGYNGDHPDQATFIVRWRATNYPLFYTICCHMTSRDDRICDIVESFEFGIL